MSAIHPTVERELASGFVSVVEVVVSPVIEPYRWFPSYRSIHMMNGNMAMAVICMVNNTESATNGTQLISDIKDPNAALKVNWTPEDIGYIFGAFNAGLLCMLITGFLADRFNAKYMIIISVLIASFANFAIPLTAQWHVNYAIAARFLVGFADSLTQPALNSLLTRWFPSAERSYALSIATGGRQIGTLLIVPTTGALCAQSRMFGGWPSIFYLSAITGIVFVTVYLFVGADKPSKQVSKDDRIELNNRNFENCIADEELRYITLSNSFEDVGKKRTERQVPWIPILKSAPVWAALISVVCHGMNDLPANLIETLEYPLITMIMFLPSYLHDVHHYDATQNGILSSIPTASLFVSKLGSSYLNTWLQKKTSWNVSKISKVLNGVGSAGLALFMVAATFLDETRAPWAVVFLSCSMAFTGLHTPGCQAALVAVAPAYSGAITGLTFFFVAISGMINPALTKWIVRMGTAEEWNLVFYISTVIALIPCFVFTIWGSAEVQSWARSPSHPGNQTQNNKKIPPVPCQLA
ncbi:Transporter, major facilitator family protein [Aphelenchoides besseyi]|nr:Transporter, major facilitator family protein [Aphelenchoides besseyi]